MRKRNREKGVALLFALGMLALLMVLGLAFVTNALLAQKVARNNSARAQSRMFAMSALNRAAASIMLYQQQVYTDSTAMPEDFSSIYSYAPRPGSSTETDTDGLVTKTASLSLLRLPEDDSVIAESLAKEFNDKNFAAGTATPWAGSWVYFYDKHDGSDRKIVGRAAWQVISTAPQLSAPVFFRGEMSDNGPVAQNHGFIPRQNRWGREIDEVYFANTPFLRNLNYTGTRIKDYEDIFTLFGSPDDAKKMWLKRWFTPDPAAHTGNNACWYAVPMVPEVYEYKKNASGGVTQLLRFNISEISPDRAYTDYISGASDSAADPWYLRFSINSAASDKINAEAVLTQLTQAGDTYLLDYERDTDVPVGERGGLPFLRRIGSEKGSFESLELLRKQIAANFNDYCDADSIPTSDVPAARWADTLDGGAYQEPSYTGNEKSPYLYEIGLQFSIYASQEDTEKAGIGLQTELSGLTATVTPAAVLRLAPMVKLVNLYPFVPGESSTDARGLTRTAPDNLHALVDFSDFSATMKFSQLQVTATGTWQNGLDSGSFSVATSIDPATDPCGNLDTFQGNFTLSQESWTANEPMALANASLTNANGENPYPLFYTPAESDLQKLDTLQIVGIPASVSIDAETLRKLGATIPDGATVTLNTFSLVPQKVVVSQWQIKFRRAVLLQKKSGSSFPGVDYVKARGDAITWTTPDTGIELSVNQDSLTQGVVAGLIRNYDPRQNLNNDDWSLAGETAALAVKAENYREPIYTEMTQVMAVENGGGKVVGAGNGSGDYSPAEKSETAGDHETVTEPAWKSDTAHLSTAFIRNAPMMSPWEIGLIHRGAKWQTINIRSAGEPGSSGKTITITGMAPVSGWSGSGTSYADGDGAILDQIKMTEEILTFGKINVNKFRLGAVGFDSVNDQNIVQALFEYLPYRGDMGTFIANTTRGSDGKFPSVESPSSRISQSAAEGIFKLFSENTMSYPDGLGSSDQLAGLFANRAQFLNWGIGGKYYESAFGKVSSLDNDAQQEEIIGRTINLLTAAPSTPSQVQIVVVAQAITDVEGMQYKTAPATASYSASNGGSVTIDSDGMASKDCKTGEFDAYIHGTDDSKNVYFDEITGEVKMFVTLERDTVTGRMKVRKIDYLE